MAQTTEKTFLIIFHILGSLLLSSCVMIGTKDDPDGGDISFEKEQWDEDFIREDSPTLLKENLVISEEAPLGDGGISLRYADNPVKVQITEKVGEYRVSKGDTLMWIAFKLYGDYSLWRKIYNLNQEKVGENYDLTAGTLLKYHIADKEFYPPMGSPYFIKRGDSLSRISQKVYGEYRKWPMIFKNNSRQIKDPNLIFAGFTLYYLPLDRGQLF